MNLEDKLKRAIKKKKTESVHLVFEEIYETYSKLVYFKVIQYIDNRQDANDLTQDVFLSFYENIFKSDINNIKYYLMVTAKNKALNYLKSQKNIITLEENIVYDYVDDCSNNEEYNNIIDNMKKYLSEREINILLEHIIDGNSFKDLSVKYNIPLNTVISIYHRALKKYKKGIK